MFLISTTWELSVNRIDLIDLQAPFLAEPPRKNQGAGTPCCTTPRQQTIDVQDA